MVCYLGEIRQALCLLKKKMKILALEKEMPGSQADRFQPLLRAEAMAVWNLRQRDLLREIWFDAQEHTAVILLECASLLEAEDALRELPLVQAGLIRFELHALAPYDGFARLFSKDLGQKEAGEA
jgi:hypothetical protein